MKFVKDISIQTSTIHIQFMKGVHIDEFQIQMMNKASHFIPMYKEKRAKTQLLYDIENVCSLQTYLRNMPLEEQSLLKLLIHLLETINEIQKEHYLYLSLETIFIKYDGTLCFLALPITKDSYEAIDEDVKACLQEITNHVQVHNAQLLLGTLLQSTKSSNFRMLSLLQELHQLMPAEILLPFWKRFFYKSEPPLLISYPLPIPKATPIVRKDFIEEIVEPSNETMLLFEKSSKAGYLKKENKRISIYQEEFHIGRDPNNDYALNVPSISKNHALIVQEEDGFYIKDLKSSNATYINGKKLKPDKLYSLKNKDAITLADITMEFYESGSD